ncbi:unnamed protein product [Paramecium octaurelia]|uniref:Uncharacterized protein n=1 Tax=Paramecium octaurelia TaxID=43137 RepID=A0A8S1WZA4_PAROT|nr:unnamed protein product [Paramecium octaurelia]
MESTKTYFWTLSIECPLNSINDKLDHSVYDIEKNYNNRLFNWYTNNKLQIYNKNCIVRDNYECLLEFLRRYRQNNEIQIFKSIVIRRVNAQ